MDQQSFQPNFYAPYNIRGINIDTYRIFRLYRVSDPCLQHAIKKLLRLGRSHKTREQDLKDAIDTLERLKTMDVEDRELYPPMGIVGIEPQSQKEETTFSVCYLAVESQGGGEIDMDFWVGPGWYVIGHTPFGDYVYESSQRDSYEEVVMLMEALNGGYEASE